MTHSQKKIYSTETNSLTIQLLDIVDKYLNSYDKYIKESIGKDKSGYFWENI